jgi:hypothetical protein
MASPKKVNNHEIPDLTELESENIIVRKKKLKDREKPAPAEFELENKDRQRNVKDDAKGV